MKAVELASSSLVVSCFGSCDGLKKMKMDGGKQKVWGPGAAEIQGIN